MDTQQPLPCVEVEPEGEVRSSVVWLHGLGADGHDFPPIVPHLGLDPALGVRFVFPHAPSIPVSINGGFVMPAWYDIRDANLANRHDAAGIVESAERVEVLLARERERGVPAGRTILAGFSQGGAIALHVGLRHAERLAGIVALSTYVVLPDTLEAERSDANLDVPIFQAHGSLDPMVRLERGVEARDRLKAAGYAVEWREYPMQHEVCLEEIAELGAWLGARLSG